MQFDQRECPECGLIATADFVDIGVGMQQCGPFGCEACGWTEAPSHPGDFLTDDLEHVEGMLEDRERG